MVQETAQAAPAGEQRHERQRQILEAASELFRRRGVDGTGMRDIAAALDMAVGNLYYYFRDKGEIVAFCQEDTLAGLLALAEEVRAMDAPPAARLERLVRGHLERLHRATPGSLAHLELEALPEAFRARVVERRDAYELVFRQLVAEGVASGDFRAVDPALAARTILGALNWTARWYRPRPGEGQSVEELAAGMADLLLGGIVVPGRKAGEGR